MKNTAYIAKKIIASLRENNKYSKPIVNVSIGSIAISCIVMLLSLSIVTGFQKEIKEKVIGFSSHIQVQKSTLVNSFESAPIEKKQLFLAELANESSIEHIQQYAYKPGIIQAKADTVFKEDGDYKLQRDIQGVIFKGIDEHFKSDFLKSKILKGTLFEIQTDSFSDSILISTYLAGKLKINVGDEVTAYFIKKDKPRPVRFIVSGIYETGMEEFDKQFAFIDIKHIQKLNNWGIEAQLIIDKTPLNGNFYVNAIGFGGNSNYLYDWDLQGNFIENNTQRFAFLEDTTIRVAISDFDQNEFTQSPISIPDTAILKIQTKGKRIVGGSEFEVQSLNDSVNEYFNAKDTFYTTLTTTGGSWKYYTGGFEFFIRDFDKIQETDNLINRYIDPFYKVTTIDKVYPEIFNWLEILDTNVYVIILLMIMVCVVNISSLLLVLILERTSMIGIFKALGVQNIKIREIFIRLSMFIVIRGLLIGNSISLVFFLLQKNFNIIKLPQENYFLSSVPVEISLWQFLFVNGVILLISATILFFTSIFIAMISPIKAIKFN